MQFIRCKKHELVALEQHSQITEMDIEISYKHKNNSFYYLNYRNNLSVLLQQNTTV